MTRNESLPVGEQEETTATSAQYAGRWHRLISNTNWEKGRIILAWRAALQAKDASPSQWSDEAWSTLVGGISPQHVGRLRRVAERFGSVYSTYPGLYWSHFCAALDWPDAEMWLEGAVHNGWSVSQMRTQRWQAYGAVPHQRPADGEIVAVEPLEDAATSAEQADVASRPILDAPPRSEPLPGPDLSQGPDFGEEPSAPVEATDPQRAAGPLRPALGSVQEVHDVGPRPFAQLPELPADLQEALNSMRIAILRHKASGYRDVSLPTVLAVLEALKVLASAPSGTD
jgi:hypothetical protein